VSHHAHDSEESARPLIFSGVIPIGQRHDAIQHVGHKLAKELLYLTSFSNVLFYHFEKYEISQKCYDIDGSAWMHPNTQGLPGLG
jgi:hypothetical protein